MSSITNQPTNITIEPTNIPSTNACTGCTCLNYLTMLPVCLTLLPFTCIYNACATKKIAYSLFPTKEYSHNICLCVYSE
jgi:hypothetical protein